MAGRVRNERARPRVVEAAWRVVADEGVQGATMRRIAAEAGVTTGFVTHYFDDKQQVLFEVLRHNNAVAARRVRDAVGEQRGIVALEGAIEALLPIDEDRRRVWQVWVAAWRPTSGYEPLTEELRNGRDGTQRLFQRMLEQAVEDGELPVRLDAAFEAERLVTLIAGTGLIAGVESPEHMTRAAKRMLAEQIASLDPATREEIEG